MENRQWEKKHNEARLIIKDYFQLTHNLNSGTKPWHVCLGNSRLIEL